MEDEQYKNLVELKIALLGIGALGKTNMLLRFVHNKYDSSFINTIGGAYYQKTIQIDKYKIKLHLFDTPGQDRFRPMTNLYFRDCDGIIFVCDITDYVSYNHMIDFIKYVNSNRSNNYIGIICANKCDVEKERKITKEELVKIGISQNMEVFEVSAKTGKNINKAFHRIVELILKERKDMEILEHMNNEKFLYNFRLDLISSNNYNNLDEVVNIFCDDFGNFIGRKIFEFNNYKIGVITYANNKIEKKQFLNKMKSKEDGIIFFLDINKKCFFEEIKELIDENIQNNSEGIIVEKINSSEYESYPLSKEIENYSLNKKIKIFKIVEINEEIINNIFKEIISSILKKIGNNQINKEFNKYIFENKIYNFKYALIGDKKYSGKTEIFEDYFNFDESKVGKKFFKLNKYKIKLEIYDIDESNIIELLNHYKINGIIFIFSQDSLESFKKIKEYIDIIKQNYFNDYESIICANKSNFNINDEKISKEINNDFFAQNIDIYYDLNAKDNFERVLIQLTYQILFKKKKTDIISELYECYKEYLPIHG